MRLSKGLYMPKTNVNKNSMLYWYPLIKTLDIPQPRTLISEKKDWRLWAEFLDNPQILSNTHTKKIFALADIIGYPLFMRTDLASGKHNFNKTCFVRTHDELRSHIPILVDENFIHDFLLTSLVFREYIELESGFTAFWGKLPIARERRYFFKDGKILCHHPYWPEDAITNPSVENWKVILAELNRETKSEITLLSKYAKQVASHFEGYWSVDFAHAKDGRWLLIDMALGLSSWHPECKIATSAGVNCK